jgi:23S rRNA pseudouridine1911/1915/1917 synthase
MLRESRFSVLYEDNHLLVVNKPAGLPTMGVEASKSSLLTVAKSYIADKYRKPGNVYLGIVSRLDAPVTGIVVIARTSKAAGRLSQQFREGTVQKSYLALVQPAPPASEDPIDCTDWLVKHERHRKVMKTNSATAGAQEAKLRYQVLGRKGQTALLQVQLLTGRKHQIRVQLSTRRFPILGDRKYNSVIEFPTGIALHAAELTIEHPTQKEPMRFQCGVPKYWKNWMPDSNVS